jgi:DnaJ-class molecular chaperone
MYFYLSYVYIYILYFRIYKHTQKKRINLHVKTMKICIFLIIVNWHIELLVELAYFDQKINPYEILDVSKNADKQAIHDAYKKLVKSI